MFQAVANSALYHCGYKWLVVDAEYKTISKRLTKENAEEEAYALNEQVMIEHDAAIRLMELRREFLECSKIIGIEKVYSCSMLEEIIEICEKAKEER